MLIRSVDLQQEHQPCDHHWEVPKDAAQVPLSEAKEYLDVHDVSTTRKTIQ